MAEDTVSTWADLADREPETREQTYRRAYRDGWKQAVEAFSSLMFEGGRTRNQALGIVQRHWQWALLDWLRGDCAKREPPPTVKDEWPPRATH